MRLHGVADVFVALAPRLVTRKSQATSGPRQNDVNYTNRPFLLAVEPMDQMVSDDVVHTHVNVSLLRLRAFFKQMLRAGLTLQGNSAQSTSVQPLLYVYILDRRFRWFGEPID